MAIKSFKCSDTEALYESKHPKRFRNIESVAERKLQMLDDAVELRDLRSPPGNRLELLSGDRTGQHGIRINDQWRVCFVWTDAGPASVEIVDYH
jgi:proteic killer suppression protein